MENNLYVLFNNLSLRYGDVFSSPTNATAAFSVENMLRNNPQYPPESYQLCHVGTINLVTGEVKGSPLVRVPLNVPHNVENIEKTNGE